MRFLNLLKHTIGCSLVLAVVASLSVIPASAVSFPAKVDVKDLLKPYIEEIDTVNREINANYVVLPGKEQQVYNHVKIKTPKQLGKELREEYYSEKDNLNKEIDQEKRYVKVTNSFCNYTAAATCNYYQTSPISGTISSLYARARVTSIRNSKGFKCYFSSTPRVGSEYSRSRRGYHFEGTITKLVNNDNTAVLVRGTGLPVDQNDIALAEQLHPAHIFYAVFQ